MVKLFLDAEFLSRINFRQIKEKYQQMPVAAIP